MRYTLTPARSFDPSMEEIWRGAAVLLRAARSGPWWAPARAKSVRIRLRADGTGETPLAYSLEGHTSARHLLSTTPYDQVTVERCRPVRDREREHTLRAQFVLRGDPGAPLRDVPLQPDPLQPIVDAVSAVRADLGDLAEVIVDLQPVPTWRLHLKRGHLAATARSRAQTEARKATRRAIADTDAIEDSLAVQLAHFLDFAGRRSGGRRMAMTIRPRPVDTGQVWGRLANDVGLVRLQLLVRCASDVKGRAERSLKALTAAMDVSAGRSRLRVDGARLGPWQWSANHALRRGGFDRRWTTGLVAPRADSWLNIAELSGLLKPPTVHCRQPLTAATLPGYELGAPLMPQGWYRAPDGTTRLIASPLEETLFSVSVGKSFYGKTTRAVVQALAVALAGDGVFFVDPHADSWDLAAPFLAHESLRDRVWRIDLTGRDAGARLPSWNPLGMDAGQRGDEVVRAAVDSFSIVLGWGDHTAPRATTVLFKALEALVEVNRQAVAANKPQAQATVFQVRTLLTDAVFREAVLDRVPDKAKAWWTTTFTAYGDDAFAPVLNPLDRLAADPVARALLGAPTGKWNARAAMDKRRIVWLCLGGTGPTQRLLVNLLMRDVFRAGLSRGDQPTRKRKPFHIWMDELISLDQAGTGSTIADITEQLRKFGVRLHVMAQLLERISSGTRASLLQNASALSTTAGSLDSVGAVTEQWHGALTVREAAELPRYHHALSFTAGGKQRGPLTVRGPQPAEVFGSLKSSKHLGELSQSSAQAVGARTASYLHKLADQQDAAVLAFLTGPTDRTPPPPHPEPPPR
ncbi:ATP/GTP-binding protein, partial [Streptacidiphilus anmyonensis]|uniref:ATP/GTP-binding protein n=1 Tax=Streptacidiphilus anmyonensis TaxID=405782 RepID=UPI001364D116